MTKSDNSDIVSATALLIAAGAQRESVSDIYYILLDMFPNFHSITDPIILLRAATLAINEYNEYRFNSLNGVY